MKYVACVHRLTIFRGDAEPHASGDKQGILAILFQRNIHNANIKLGIQKYKRLQNYLTKVVGITPGGIPGRTGVRWLPE